MPFATGSPNAFHAALVLLSVLPLACGFPTDQSDEVFVTIESPTTVVVRGGTLVLRGAVWQQRAGAQVRAAGASLEWTSDKPSVASVVPREDGSALLTGINSGTVKVQATARDYQGARPAALDIRVANTVEIDSVRPTAVRYGEQVTLYGVGLGRIAQVALGETSLIPDSASFSGDPNGLGRQRFWVPYPAVSGRVLATATEGFSAPAAQPTEVIPRTVFFSSDSSPATIRLDNSAATGGVLFHNPALAVTAEGGGNRFHFVLADTTRPVTIVVSTTPPVITSMVPTLSPPLPLGADGSWSTGTATQRCGPAVVTASTGLDFKSNPATLVRSLQRTPSEGLLLEVDGASPGRFAVTVMDGFRAADPRIQPDRFEENDSCVAADSNSRNPATRIELPAGLADTLTIDQGYEMDWFRFTVPHENPGHPFVLALVTARTVSRPFGAADSSNLGLALASDGLRAGVDPSHPEVEWLAESHTPGSSERVSAELLPGDYYLVVSDEAGVPTRYGVCIAIGNDCVPAAP